MKKITLVFALAGSILLSSCDVLTELANQFTSVANLANCEFNLKNVSNVTVAGINVKNVTQGNLSATDVVKLVAAYQAKKVPLSMNVNVDVTNPTTTHSSAAMMLNLFGRRFDKAQFMNGTMMQYVPVRNALLPGVVSVSPNVCR